MQNWPISEKSKLWGSTYVLQCKDFGDQEKKWQLATGGVREALKKVGIFKEYFLNKGGGFGNPKLFVKFWWPLFLALNFTFLFLNLAKIQLLIPKYTEEAV